MATNISISGDTKKSASYVLTLNQYLWVKSEARRLRISDSELVRAILDREIAASEPVREQQTEKVA